MLYNIHFKVKYFDIQQELLAKLDGRGEGEYTKQDVLDICYKLYTDELCSVFHVENILDKSFIQEVLQQVLNNSSPFKTIVEDLVTLLLDDFLTNLLGEEGQEGEEEGEQEGEGEGEETDYKENCQHFVSMLLFSKDVFHITHKCIVQQLSDIPIDEDLLKSLKDKCLEVIYNKYIETN